MIKFYMFIAVVFPVCLYAQTDSIAPAATGVQEDQIEDFIQSTGEESDFDFNTVFENLAFYESHPLDLNECSREDLSDLNLLTELQVNNLMQYRLDVGKLIALYELQAVPGFDLPSIRRILPYVSVGGDWLTTRIPFKKLITSGENTFFMRWDRVLEEKHGYSPLVPGQSTSRYLGDANHYYLRFKHNFSNRFSAGFTAEKDPGEPFFAGQNKNGFDYYSAHLYWRDPFKGVKALAIGDFMISFGQGLVLFNGFAPGKSSTVTNIKRNAKVIRPYTSVNEASFMRGAAATFSLSKKMSLTTFASYRYRDANVLAVDTTDLLGEDPSFSSLQLSGLHRTTSEMADKNALQQFAGGGCLDFEGDQLHVSGNILYNRFDKTLKRAPALYNQYQFSGNQLINASIDYSYLYRNINFFGETAISDNGAVATVNGILMSLDKTFDLSLLHRYLPRNYQVIAPNPFAESSSGSNEQGLYLGIQYRPGNKWLLSAYADIWKHPWLRFNVDAPSVGSEYLVRLTYTRKKEMDVYFQFKLKTTEKNASAGEADYSRVAQLVEATRLQARFQLSYKINPFLELRNRIEYSWYKAGIGPSYQGYLVYQDAIFKPKDFPLSLTARVALFDTDGYNARIYAYENDILYSFSVPPYYGKGIRYYLNLRYRASKLLTIEAQIAQTRYSHQDVISSGLEAIMASHKTLVKGQVTFHF